MQEALPEVYPVVYACVFGCLGNEDLAWDATNEACVVALNTPEKFEGNKADLVKWLRKVAVHKAADMRKRKQPRRLPNNAEHLIGDEQAAPAVDEVEMKENVRRCLERLPAEERATVVLKHWQELGFQEIGNRLYGNEGSPMARLLRARRRYVKGMERLCRLRLEEGVPGEEW